MNYVVFDLEIKNVIDGKLITWDDHGKMGISVGCAFDSKTGRYSAHMDDNLPELVELLEAADVVVGFNIEGFDIPLLEATIGRKLNLKNVYDILYWSRRSIGWMPADRFPTGLKLDDHLEGTFGKDGMKTAHGAEAPLMFQRGEIGRLTSYCLADVAAELRLFQHIQEEKSVKTATHGSRMIAPCRLPKLLSDSVVEAQKMPLDQE